MYISYDKHLLISSRYLLYFIKTIISFHKKKKHNVPGHLVQVTLKALLKPAVSSYSSLIFCNLGAARSQRWPGS